MVTIDYFIDAWFLSTLLFIILWNKVKLQDLVFVQEGRLPQVLGRVRYRQRQEGSSWEQLGSVQSSQRHRYDRAAADTPHPPGAGTQLLRLLLRDPQFSRPRLQVSSRHRFWVWSELSTWFQKVDMRYHLRATCSTHTLYWEACSGPE